ncbi:hypothetical protein EGI22_11750 [Lacihabitans sp. LS3-19]|uniref:FUSC family protein n=1 Tax=Lacihabitans sp. LS3-19 TaxID=2487335 RepID=UPI0020CE9BC6|nr:FUSC family membrane protein [Lacihabitans sp. LS3-19]MCP9768589.1 hypothetical protein [Lacihabitans sp. LS3-19]
MRIFVHYFLKILIAKIAKHINSFDFFRAAIVSLILSAAIFWGFSTHQYPQGISIVVGVMLAYFSNIEGTNRNRIFGMFSSLTLGLVVVIIFFLVKDLPVLFNLAILSDLIFGSSMLSVFGFRGSMIGFAGLFAIVMGFMLKKSPLAWYEIASLVAFGGLFYILVSSISHFLFQKRHTQLLLADCVELTAKYLKLSDAIKWHKNGETADSQFQLLKVQSAINDNHELLRSLLLSEKTKLISNEQSQKLYLLFIEMLDIYEMAIASNPEIETFQEVLGDQIDLLEPFTIYSEKVIENLESLCDALRKNNSFELSLDLEILLISAEKNIAVYVQKIKLPAAREGALMMRSLYDLKLKQFEKLKFLYRVYNNLLNQNSIVPQRNSAFITTNNYSWNTIKNNLNTDSVIFRHAVRLTVAFLLSYFIGQALNPAYSNWIIVTTMVILRPNYGLTKSRAKSRMIGTVLGMIFTLALVYFSGNHLLYGWVAVVALLVGFSNIQKNYLLASAGLTISILLLYVLNEKGTIDVILFRGLYTLIGVLISLFAMYFVWPIWEKENIKDAVKNAISANLAYLESVNVVYKTKEPLDTQYRLVRKEAFLKNGNLNGAFQRLKDEPKSKKDSLSNIYAIVLLNHNFLSAVASYSAYIQGHKTTKPSVEFEIVMENVYHNLNMAIGVFEEKDIAEMEGKTRKAFDVLDKKYAELNIQRNKEIDSGVSIMSDEMRSKLQEGKVILEQLRWFINLSENILGACGVLG